MFNKKYATPNGLQLALVISGIVAYVVGFLQTASLFAQHATTNPNFSGIWSLLIWQAIPALLFVTSYFLNPRKKLTQNQRMFEAMVLTFTGLAAFATIMQVAGYLMNVGIMMEGSNYAVYELTLVIIMLLGFGGVLWFLGRTKRWK